MKKHLILFLTLLIFNQALMELILEKIVKNKKF